MDSHATRNMGENFMTIIETDTESGAWQCLQNLPLYTNQFFVVGHILYEKTPLTQRNEPEELLRTQKQRSFCPVSNSILVPEMHLLQTLSFSCIYAVFQNVVVL